VLVLAGLCGWRVEAFGSDLQQIADALDVSSIKTFQFTGNGRMYAGVKAPAQWRHGPDTTLKL
jgi:hypothetical protein